MNDFSQMEREKKVQEDTLAIQSAHEEEMNSLQQALEEQRVMNKDILEERDAIERDLVGITKSYDDIQKELEREKEEVLRLTRPLTITTGIQTAIVGFDYERELERLNSELQREREDRKVSDEEAANSLSELKTRYDALQNQV